MGIVGGAAVAFLIGAPYSIIDLPGFLNGFAALMQHYNQERGGADSPALVYMKHIADWFSVIVPGGKLYRDTSWPAMMLCAVGASNIAWRAFWPATRALSLVLLVFPVAYFFFISSHSLVFARYAMPILPALCIAFGRGVEAIWTILPTWVPQPRYRRIALALMLFTVLPPAVQAFSFDLDRRQVSTTELTAQWLMDHVQPGEFVVLESSAITLPPKVKSENTLRLITEPLDAYRAKGATYLVSTSAETDKYFNAPGRFPGQIAKYKALLEATHIVMIFSPIKGERPGPTWQVLKVDP